MSEEKLYAIKNDEGKLADSHYNFGFCAWVTPDKNMREEEAKHNGGHVVTLIEEPEKVVLTKEQAEVVEDAHNDKNPACYISSKSDDEELLMKAYVNGWTVNRPHRWCVKTPDNWMGNEKQGWLYKITGSINTISEDNRECTPDEQFTESEIEHYGLQGFEKKEVTDDGMGC